LLELVASAKKPDENGDTASGEEHRVPLDARVLPVYRDS
jgi:hypothetical protein